MPSHHKHRHHADPHLPDHAIDSPPAADGDRDSPSSGHSLESGRGLDADEEQLRERIADHHRNLEEMSNEEKIANLMQLNDALVKQVASSRAAKEELIGKIIAMEEELQKVVVRADALLKENNWMADERCRLELEVAGIQSEKAALLVEKQDVLEAKLELENSLSKSRTELFDAREQKQEARREEALAQEKAEKLKSDVEQLLVDKQDLTGEIDALRAQNASVERDLRLLQGEKKSVEEELNSVRNSCAAAEGQVVDAKTVIKDLQSEISSRTEDRDQLDKQLKEAWQRIASLEAQQEAGIAKHDETESRIKNLENELLAVRNAHGSSSALLEQERKAKGALDDLLAAAHAKGRGLEGDLDSLKSSFVKVQDDSNRDQQRISSLESEVSSLCSENVLLEENKRSQIKNLENELLAVRNAHASSSAILEQERKAKEAVNDLLLAAYAKGRGLERDLDSLKSSLVKLQDDSNRGQERISSLESEVSSLGSEKASLEENKRALGKKVRMLNSALMKASAASKTKMEKLTATSRDLEQALADAKEEVSHRNDNVSQLEIDLQELKSFFEEKSRLTRLAWSLAAVSTGALAVVGVSTVLRRSK